jgi:hypothetical protein
VSEMTVDALEDILELSSYLLMDPGRQFALSELELWFLSPVTKLVIAQRHHLTGWIPAAVRALVARPPLFFSSAEYETLGSHNLFILDRTRSQINRLRLSVALRAPNVMHDELTCDGKEACTEAWDAAW